jgi:hypothetical protein
MVLGFWLLHHDDIMWSGCGCCMQMMDLTDTNSWRTTNLWPNLTDQRFLLAGGLVICDVSALIDHNLFAWLYFSRMMWFMMGRSLLKQTVRRNGTKCCRLQLQPLQMQKNIRETIYTCIHDCCSDDYGACEITYL